MSKKKKAYFELTEGMPDFPVEGVSIRQETADCLTDLSQKLGSIRIEALNRLDVGKARIAADYQLRVDFMVLHIDQEIIDLIDNSDELAAVQSTIDKANKSLAKIKAKTESLGNSLDRAAAILGEFEKLVDWVQSQ